MAYEGLDLREAVSLYLELQPGENVDLEVAAAMAIDWSRAMKAAGAAIDSTYDYRVSLIAAKPGSKNWLAKLERSKANQLAKDVQAGWEEVPLILRWTIALVVVIPLTAHPTWEYWMGGQGFSDKQMQQLELAFARARVDDTLLAQKRKMYKDAQRDRTIIGIGGGVPDGPDWRPNNTVPSNQFYEVDGLFDLEEEVFERTTPQELDVILVAPDLENAHRAWEFKQQGIPGRIRAIMRDDRFLNALETSSVKERFRTEIPMRIRLEIKERKVDGVWKVPRGGRSVVEVISPAID